MTALDLQHLDEFDRDGRTINAFSTRSGGVSTGPYASLNLTRSRGDEAQNVAQNRERLRRALGLDYLAFATQVHGRAVLRVASPPKGEQVVGEGDALITDQPGIGLCCQTADCTPILLHDRENRAVAAIHSGWRGTVQNIVAATIDAMAAAYGTQPDQLEAAIGPSISQANYRVGPEVLAAFEREFTDTTDIISPRDADGGAQLDVAAACRQQLQACGLPDEQITQSSLCTYAEEDRLFSARRSHHRGETGLFGGQVGVIALRKP